MEKKALYELLIPKDRDLDRIAEEAIENPSIISYLTAGLENDNARIKYGCLNTMVLLSEKNPGVLYPFFDLFSSFLKSEKNVVKLGSIKILSNLTPVDTEKKFDKIFETYFAFMKDPEMTTAANVSKGSATIAKVKPYLREKIVNQLLTVSHQHYKTVECKNILIGHVITALDKMFKDTENKKPVLDFVKENSNNPWKGTKQRAEKFLKKHNQ